MLDEQLSQRSEGGTFRKEHVTYLVRFFFEYLIKNTVFFPYGMNIVTLFKVFFKILDDIILDEFVSGTDGIFNGFSG